MKPKEFKYDQFRYLKEEKDKQFYTFVSGEKYFIPIMQRPTVAEHWGALCRYKDKSLESQLEFLSTYFELKSDFMYSYLEPWHGVGIYAAAYGSPFNWCNHDAPQTEYIYNTCEELKYFKKPDIARCEVMQMVLDTICYFKEQTGNMLDICLTDTQSPNDTASLIMDACEFFTATVTEPEVLLPFLESITDTIIQFSEEQMQAIGNKMTTPGHAFPSAPGSQGIAISDDNMAILSPIAYANTAFDHNQRLSKHFGGIAIHSCGNFAHNAAQLAKIENLLLVDCAIGLCSDPTPNDPAKLAEIFAGTNIILKVRLGQSDINALNHIVRPDLRLIIELTGNESIEEKNRMYEDVREKIDTV